MDDDQAALIDDERVDFEEPRELRGSRRSVAPSSSRPPATEERANPAEFARQVRDEMRQVAWPTRSEVLNYTAVVLTTLVIMTSLIFVLNYAFGKGVLFLFKQ